MAECDRQLKQYLQQREDRSQGAPLPEEKRKGRLKKKRANKPQFDLREGLFRMTGTDLTRIDGIDVMTAMTIISEAGWDMSKWPDEEDRKSTRLNSSHPSISYAVFCLKKKNKNQRRKIKHSSRKT